MQKKVEKNSQNKKEVPSTMEFLGRRDRSAFVPQNRSWPDLRALLSSCVFHTVLLLTFGILWRSQTRGTSGEADRPVGIAVLHETNQGNEYYLSGGSNSGNNSSVSTKVQAASLSINDAGGPPISIEKLMSDLVGASNPAHKNGSSLDGSQGFGLSGDGKTAGNGSGVGRGSGNKAKTTFFGVEGSGSSFVYVVDRSDSMNAYRSAPFLSAKRELLKSLDSLKENHQFQIVFYNDHPTSLGVNLGRMVYANESDKRRAASFVKNMPGDGATQHLPALKLGLTFAPNVLFFLTDAEDPSLSPSDLKAVQRLADQSLTTIHAIQFSIGPATNDGGWIRELAENNRGTYKYVDVTTLP